MSKIRTNQIETLDGLTTKNVSSLVDQSDLDALSVEGAVKSIDTLASLKALANPSLDTGYYVTTGLQAGLFYFDASNLSTEVSGDSPGGVYIAPNSDPTGASGAFVRESFGLLSVADYGIEEGSGNSSGWPSLESEAETNAKTSGADIIVTPEDVTFPNRAIKTWKRPAGIKDGAVAASFTLHPDETERTTQVTGFNDYTEIGSYLGRDSVGLFFQNYAIPPLVNTNNTTFTSISVTSPDFISVWDDIQEGMLIEINRTSSWVSGVIVDKQGNDTLIVNDWRKVDGTSSIATTPSSGANAQVNVYTVAFGMNGNARVTPNDAATRVVGMELGVLCDKAGSGSQSVIYDAVNLSGLEKPGVGYRVRGGVGLGFAQSGDADTGFYSQDATVGMRIANAKGNAIETSNPAGKQYVAQVSGVDKFSIESDGRCGNLYTSTVVVSSSTTLATATTVALVSTAGVTVTLPGASGKSGKLLFVRNADLAGSITISRSPSPDITLANSTGILFVSDGSQWQELMRS